MVYLVYCFLHFVFKGTPIDAPTVQEIIPQETKMTKEGFRVLTGPAPYLINMVEPNQTYSVDIYVNTYSPDEFFGPSLNELRYGRK